MSNFQAFAQALVAHFVVMSQSELYRVAIPGDVIWNAYLGSFPEGTNPIFRVRTEHDGSYDRAFVRKVGNVVRINDDGSLTSIWDIPNLQYPYNEVCAQLSQLAKAAAIDTLFRINERKIGVVSNIENRDGVTHQWFHFHADIATKHYSRQVDTDLGAINTTVQVMRRGFSEILPDAVASILDLIETGNLYRGTEFKAALLEFQRLQNAYRTELPETAISVLLWKNYKNPAARLRNTVIGTLLTDLSEGMDLERAVKVYETKVAPTNYKRPTALITQRMIDDATKTIDELGLRSALERRFAVISDVSVNNVLWVDNQVQPLMRDGLKDLLMPAAKTTPATPKAIKHVGIDDFVSEILPKAIGLEMFFSNQHQGSLMSLTAPVHTEVAPLFKWGNNFAWAYNGNITDSIKEKVKAAGGNTNAVLRVSLAWYNRDDLDLHAHCPDGHVYFGCKSGGHHSRNRQILDVDMNAGRGTTRTPVENLSWIAPENGHYCIDVHQYCRRETSDVGFTIEVENAGTVTQFSYAKAAADRIKVLEFDIKNQKVHNLKVLDKNVTGQGIAQHKWGLTTETFVKVDTVLNSPNHWDGEHTGNKHWFFILANCHNDEPTRGIFNEFLKPELETHRKVFEVLGNKTKCLPSTDQLSGLGFSSTKRDSVIVRVTDQTSTRTYQVNF